MRLIPILLVVVLTGCTVYTPLQPPVPDVRAKGQLEVSGGVRLSTHVEGAATYSPLNHLLLRVAGGCTPLPAGGPGVQFSTAQLEGSLGTYWPLGQRWLVGGFVGSGLGRSRLWAPHSMDEEYYRTRFYRPYGEAYLHWHVSPFVSVGAAYRLQQVRYSAFTNAGLPTTVRRIGRSEPLVFVRVGDDWHAQDAVVLGRFSATVLGQVSCGLSQAHGPRQHRTGDITDRPAYQAKYSTVYSTLSIIIRPRLLRRIQP